MTFIWVYFWLETDILANGFLGALTLPCCGHIPPRQCPHLWTHSKSVPLSLTRPYALGKLLLFSDLGTCFGGMCPKMGQNCVTLAWELSHARAMDTIACATFLASGHTPKVCPYVSLGVTVTRNHYFSLCHSPDSAEWYYASYMHMGQKT